MTIHAEQQLEENKATIPGSDVSLESIFSGHPANGRSGQLSDLSAHVISHGGVPRWVLPGDTRRALNVLGSWKPYKVTSRLQWSAVVGACRLNALSMLPGVTRQTLRCDLSYWREELSGFSDLWSIVAYIGNPSPTRKTLMFFIDEQGKVQAVAKVPIRAEAKTSILNEARVLRKIRDRFTVAEVLFQDKEQGIAAQSWMEGDSVSLEFSAERLELLTNFGSANGLVRLCDCRDELEAQTASLDLPIDRSILGRALALLDVRDELRSCLEHGDFVPWNMRRLKGGQLTLIDWEWAVEEGFPWQDICHYFYLQDYLFQKKANVWKILTTHPLLSEYSRRFELSPQAVRGLTIRYLLRYMCVEYAEGDSNKVGFAARKIREVMKASK